MWQTATPTSGEQLVLYMGQHGFPVTRELVMILGGELGRKAGIEEWALKDPSSG